MEPAFILEVCGRTKLVPSQVPAFQSCLRRSRSSRRLLPPVNCGLFSGRFGTGAFLPELVERCLEKKVLEIAPIGFMRGRTLNGLLAGG